MGSQPVNVILRHLSRYRQRICSGGPQIDSVAMWSVGLWWASVRAALVERCAKPSVGSVRRMFVELCGVLHKA